MPMIVKNWPQLYIKKYRVPNKIYPLKCYFYSLYPSILKFPLGDNQINNEICMKMSNHGANKLSLNVIWD